MQLGIFFDGFSSSADMLDGVLRAEEAGIDSAWFAQHMGYHDAIVWASAAAQATKRIRVMPTSVTPYLWAPLPVAMTMATLSEMSGGRAGIAVSVGNVLNLHQSGVDMALPVRVLREYVETLIAFRKGDSLDREGALHRLRGARLIADHDAQYPIYLASTGPQLLRLAGQIADGVLLSGGLTHSSCQRALTHVASGLDLRPDAAAFRKAAFIYCVISEDGEAARAAMLRKLAYLFRSKNHADNIASSGLDIDHAAIIECLGRHDLDSAVKLLPGEAATVFGVAGTPDECRKLLAGYQAIGLNELIVELSGDAEQRRLGIEMIQSTAQWAEGKR